MVISRSFGKVICLIDALPTQLNFTSFWTVYLPRQECLSCLECDKACGNGVKLSLRLPIPIPVNRALDCIVCHK